MQLLALAEGAKKPQALLLLLLAEAVRRQVLVVGAEEVRLGQQKKGVLAPLAPKRPRRRWGHAPGARAREEVAVQGRKTRGGGGPAPVLRLQLVVPRLQQAVQVVVAAMALQLPWAAS